MKDDQTTSPLTVEYVDWVISQVRHLPEQQKQYIKEFERNLLQKQKEKKIFLLTINALQEQYHHLQKEQYQVIEKEEIELDQLKRTISKNGINYQQQHEEQELKYLEKQLQDVRDDAERRRNKKAKREKQYHEVYHLPFINHQFKKKYLRARDKNNAVEQQLADLHHQMDHIKNKLRQTRLKYDQDVLYYQKRSEQLEILIQKLNDQQSILADMKKAHLFWSQFDTLHSQPCLKWVQDQLQFKSNHHHSYDHDRDHDDYFSHHRRRHSSISLSSSSSSPFSLFSFNDWHSFRSLIKEYEEAETYSHHKKWNPLEQSWHITFHCHSCQSSIQSWPYLDKVRTNQLLCSSCYYQNRTSMIVEKKLQTFLPKNELATSVATHLSRPNLLFRYSTNQLSSSSSSSSMMSTPSFIQSTSKSTHQFINDCKPFMKKMKSALSLNQHETSEPLPHPLFSR
ncbi:unnamed protein product [Cunninghamella blakesleeana]